MGQRNTSDSGRLLWGVGIGGCQLRMRTRSGLGCGLVMRLSRRLERWDCRRGQCVPIWCAAVGSVQQFDDAHGVG
jgi:hypothetical protein